MTSDMDVAVPAVSRVRRFGVITALGVVLIVLFAGSFLLGRYPISPLTGLQVIWTEMTGGAWSGPSAVSHVILNIRLPRLLAAMLIGLALSLAGVVYQGMFRNPLVSPDLLGASAGAGFGASIAITLGLGLIGVQMFAFGLGMIAVLLAWLLASGLRRDKVLGLILAGIVVSALMSSGTSFLKYIADPDDVLPAITFWLMGGLTDVNSGQVQFLLIPIVLCAIVLGVMRWQLNVLTFGDDEATALGVPVRRLRAVMIVLATLLTTAAVCVGGLVAWVGLVVPHFARMMVGPDFRVLLPTAGLLGAIFVLAVDNVSRVLFTVEIPLGLLTSVVGAPFLAVMMYRSGRW